MRVVRDFNSYCEIKNPVVALGNFDGIHIGHQALIKKTVEVAKKINGTAALFTFYPHPIKVVEKRKEPFIIQTFKEKVKIAQSLGIETVVCARFTKNFANMHPEDFIKDILINKLEVKSVCVGHDYTFGRGGKGGIKTLREYANRYGFELSVIPPVKIDGIIVSSSKIREFLRDGNIEYANKFLGRPYKISGVVRKGDGRGASLGYPTANIYPKNEIILKNGVYAAYVYVDSKKYKAAVNVGNNPTFKGVNKHIEVFIMEFNKNIYSKKIEIEFVDFIRDEKRFRRVDELIARIDKDIKIINNVL